MGAFSNGTWTAERQSMDSLDMGSRIVASQRLRERSGSSLPRPLDSRQRVVTKWEKEWGGHE